MLYYFVKHKQRLGRGRKKCPSAAVYSMDWVIFPHNHEVHMDIETLKTIARQLRKPEGEPGIQVAIKMNEGNRYINRFTIEALGISEDDNILEIGMGNGFFVKDILSVARSVKYVGCDFSSLMIAEGVKLNKSFVDEGRAEFHLASADELPFDDERFESVFTVNTIYFWDDAKVVLAEIHRVLKPGGKIIIAVRPKSSMEHYPFVKFGFKMFSKEDLTELLSKNKFEVKSVLEKQGARPGNQWQ